MSKTQEEIIKQFVDLFKENQIQTKSQVDRLVLKTKNETITIKKPVNSLKSSTGGRTV